MSLFKACNWWSTQCPDFEENYDSFLLHCCRFGLENGEKDCICVGSHAGYLSIYQPIQSDTSNNVVNDFKPTDLLLEIKLPTPILQITSGTFLIGSDQEGRRQLAILHPMKLSVYTLQTTDGNAEHGKQSKLNLCFEHKFTKHAFSLCKGNFGGYKSREFFCVTHLDGTLSFFEQDGITYGCTLHGERNIPLKMAYNPRTDSFVMVTSDGELESYRYQDLGQVTEQKDENVFPNWTVCLGDFALDINVQQTANLECLIIVLGEHNIYCVSDTAVVKFVKRLDYSPLCFCTFIAGWYWEPNARLIISTVTESGTLLIYEDSRLKWAAQLNEIPVAIDRSNIDGLPGSIITLGRTGTLQVSYLGSEPLLFKVPPLNLSALDFEKTQQELVELEKDIKSGIDFTDMSLINNAAEHDLVVQLAVSPHLEPSTFKSAARDHFIDNNTHKMCSVSVALKSSVALDQIQVHFNVESPLKCAECVHFYEGVEPNSVERVDTFIYFEDPFPVSSAKVTVIVSFINKKGIPRVIRKFDYLPLGLFCKGDTPQKEAANKITISVENADVPLMETLCKEFSTDATVSGAIGLRSIQNDSIVTVVSGKNSNRFRIQSDDLKAMAVVLEIILVRIDKLKKPTKEQKLKQAKGESSMENYKIWIQPQLHTDQMLALVMEHFKLRQEVQHIRKDLQSSTTQMRLLQRRLFAKLDDKKANALHRISSFLKLTHQQILFTLHNLENANINLKKSQINLSCGLAVTRLCISKFDLPPKTTDGLCSALVTPVNDFLEQNWEELTSPPLDNLNCVGPLRKTNSSIEDFNFSVETLDMNRFTRHLKQLLDRVCRMVHKTPNDQTPEIRTPFDEQENDTILEDTAEEESDWIASEKQPVENLAPQFVKL